MTDSPTDIYEKISSISKSITCFICLDIAIEPALTPCCNHVCCNRCIKEWLQEKTTCPLCRAQISFSNIISLSWANDLKEIIPYFLKKQNFLCPNHQQKSLSYYCNTCQKLLCSDCLFETLTFPNSPHKNHSIVPIGQKFPSVKSKLKQELSSIIQLIPAITEICTKISQNSCQIQRIYEDHKMEIISSFTDIQKELKDSYSKNLVENEISLSKCQESRKKLKELLSNVEKPESQSNPIKTRNLIRNILEIALASIPSSIPSSIVNPITPPYQSAKIELTGFRNMISQFKQKFACNPNMVEGEGHFIFSKSLHLYGNTWRAKLYPFGHMNGYGTHLSFFIELKKGYGHKSRFSYKVEIVPQKECVKSFYREYISEIEESDCWGWNKFALFDDLLNENYIKPDGSLLFIFSIRPLSYCQAKRDYDEEILKMRRKIAKLSLEVDSENT